MRIQGYRCLRDVDIPFDDITTFIGPNGVGKSSVLRALDWFFNGDRATTLTHDDVSVGITPERITVEVEFGHLTDLDRTALGKYAADGAPTVRLWRRWENGVDKLSGRAMSFPPFTELREIAGAMERRTRYNELRRERPELNLPAVRSATQLEIALSQWEKEHPGNLTSTELEADTHFFGFAGQAKMTGLFDYVFVSADLRAGEEGRDIKGSIIGRILEQAVDRTQADVEMAQLSDLVTVSRENIHTEHFSEQLDTLSESLTSAVGELTSGRSINVTPVVPEFRLPQVQFSVSVVDGRARTRIDQQGHGFQRALLISALRLLAESKETELDRTIFLAIEEPELFQHPIQARAFATVLRKISSVTGRGVQVAYATHSPYFLESEGFDEIRRMTRTIVDGGAPSVRIAAATAESVARRLDGVVKPDQIHRQLMRVCLASLPEALFARVAILVEGSTEQGLLEGCGLRHDPLNKNGVIVVEVQGKGNIPLAHAILTELGVPCFVVFDGDAGCEQRAQDSGKEPAKVAPIGAKEKAENRRVLAYLGAVPEDWPQTKVHDTYAVLRDTLETYLESEWPEWCSARQKIVAEGRGNEGKNFVTYRQAAIEAVTTPPAWLSDIIVRVMALCPEG
ncbi:AAA family ATPase [Actinomadura alba]|uniref:ATP-dependent endonuclease n=1 Tax=Actinomadura alba TaxID=406431 RepID=A0ABR7LZG6_9ACTN|nr:AAA family ATPase [Actinomadura alba]MBC6470160.1 ATP-dependent endonuclease [Actinomadura alba]